MKNTIRHAHRTGRAAATALAASILAATAFGAEIDILVGTTSYVPFSTGLTAGTAVWLNADNNPALTDIRSTQRSLGYREVDYKAAFSATLAFTQVVPTTDAFGVTTYDYSAQSAATDLVGFWKGKDLPIIIGPDGHAYITDGHHTTAGYLAAVTPLPRTIIPGMDHVVTGHVVQNLYTGLSTPPDDAWWLARQSANNAFLYGPAGNQLTQPGDPGYGAATQPILPSTLAMATVPGEAGMTNDKYRGLTWGMADGIIKTGTTAANAKIAGFKKGNPATPGVDINFVEFFWSDFLRNRVVWDDTASGHALGSGQSDASLSAAPLSYYAAVANGIALARSEVFADQYGRTLTDYDALAPGNTQTWAHASKQNGTAAASDTYRMYLLDNSTVQGDITPSLVSRANNQLHIDTTAGQTIAGVIKNFGSVDINKGGTITTTWKDATLNNTTYNSTMTIAAGTGTVTFTAVNTYAGATNIGAGMLKLDGAGSIASSVLINVGSGAALDVTTTASTFTLGAAQALKNNGTVLGPVDVHGTLSGGGTFAGLVNLENDGHIAPGNSPGVETFAGGLSLLNGGMLDFELGTSSDEILITGGTFTGSGPGQTIVNFQFGPGYEYGATYTLLDWTGATPSGLEVTDFAVGTTPPFGGATFAIVGNSLLATVVPEPGAGGLVLTGLLALHGRRRRK